MRKLIVLVAAMALMLVAAAAAFAQTGFQSTHTDDIHAVHGQYPNGNVFFTNYS